MTWYWSQCVHDAGVNGTAILPGDNSDAYGIEQIQYHLLDDLRINNDLHFLVNNSTLGYYWCKISSNYNVVSIRPSLIAPVLKPTNTSLIECAFSSVYYYTKQLKSECAGEGSPTIYTRTPLPSFCPSVRMSIIVKILFESLLF